VRLWNRILVLLLIVSSLAVVGCSLFGDDDDDNNYSGALTTGSIKLSAEVDGGGTEFASLRADIKAAVNAADLKARIKVGAVTRIFSVIAKADDKKKLELKDAVVDSVPPGKQQVAIEIVPASNPDNGEAILKTIQTATVAAGQTNEDLAKAPPVVNATSTARAIAYEAWVEENKGAAIEDFAPDAAKLETMAAAIQTAITTATDLTKVELTKTDAVTTAKTEVVTSAPKVDLIGDIKAAVKTYVENTIKIYAGSITPTERTALGNVIAEDFISSGFDKAAHVANTGNETGLTLVSHTSTLTKISETEYKVDVSITISKNGKQETLNSAVDGLVFDGTSKFLAASLCPNFNDFPVMVKKQSDGSWKITGNRSKLGWFDFHIDFGNVNGSTGSQMWANVEEGKTYKIKSGYVAGDNISISAPLGKDNSTDTDWHFWDGSKTSMYPFNVNGNLWPSSVTHAGTKYTMYITFTDDTTQTFELTVPTLPTGIAAPATNAVTASIVNNKLVVTYPKNSLTGFESYEINVFGNTRAQFRVDNENTTTLEVALSGKDSEGNDYNITIGGEYWISAYAFVGKGSFAQGAGSMVRLQETPVTPPPSSQRFSGAYRIFHVNASNQNRWVGVSDINVANGAVTGTVVSDPEEAAGSPFNFSVTETNGSLVVSATNDGAVSPSGNYAVLHDRKTDDPMITFMMKKPSSAANTTLNGTYIVLEYSDDANNLIATKAKTQAYSINFNGQGGFTTTSIFDPDSTFGNDFLSGTYSVSPDGKVVFNNDQANLAYISADGNVIMSTGFEDSSNGYCAYSIFIKVGGTSFSGTFREAGVNGGNEGTYQSYSMGAIVTATGSQYSQQARITEDLNPDSPETFNYTVANGRITVAGASDYVGMIDPTGEVYGFASRSEDSWRHFSLGVKK